MEVQHEKGSIQEHVEHGAGERCWGAAEKTRHTWASRHPFLRAGGATEARSRGYQANVYAQYNLGVHLFARAVGVNIG